MTPNTRTPQSCWKPADFAARLVALGGILVLGLSLRAAEPAKKSFDVPAGDAAATLALFSAQAGGRLLYSIDSVSGLTTHAVKGEFTPQEALERMVRDTSLVIAQNSQTGALTVRKETEAEAKNGGRAAPIASSGRPNRNGKVENSKEEQAVLLTPFEVRADQDTGLVASSSLSGGRLATELKDSGIAMSIVTRDLIDALGINDLAEAMTWAPNSIYNITEGGANGDQSGTPLQVTIRGITIGGGGTGKQQRNYFPYFAPMDSYSTERYDLGRGPNAVLFGNGTMAGLSSTMTKQARGDRPFAVVEGRFGSWNYTRTTVDVNRPINDHLALRAAGVYFRRQGWRDKEFERTRGHP